VCLEVCCVDVFDSGGINVGVGRKNILFDPHRKNKGSDFVFVSHGHLDHANVNSEGKYLMSAETAQVVKARLGKEPGSVQLVDTSTRLKVDDSTTMRFFDAGHILGSFQAMVENSTSVLYTGDFKLQESVLFGRAETPSADVLVMETTFATPGCSFPDRNEVYSEMESWIKTNLAHDRNVILGGYALGKSQELTRIASDCLGGDAVVVHPQVAGLNRIYEDFGVKLGNFIDSSGPEARKYCKSGPFVGVVPSTILGKGLKQGIRIDTKRKTVAAVASGWARFSNYLKRFGAERGFVLSDHCDFNQLLEFVEEVNPRKVFTHHGNSAVFAKEIRQRFGIEASEIPKKVLGS